MLLYPVQYSADVLLFAVSFVVLALAETDAAKVE